MAGSRLKLNASGFDSAPAPYECAAQTSTIIDKLFPEGTSLGQVELIHATTYEIAASGSQAVDLYNDLDQFGNALAFQSYVFLMIKIESTTHADSLVRLRTTTTPLAPFQGSTILMSSLKQGQMMILFAEVNAQPFPMGSGTRLLTVSEENGEGPAFVTVEAWGRK